MATTQSLIQSILLKKSIVSYLDQKGHKPVRYLPNGNLQYKCPLPDHSESKPSFVVYTNSEFENFYCFGCQRKYHIIHLVSYIEGIPFKTAVQKLGDGMEISTEEELTMMLKQIDKEYQQQKQKPGMDLSQTMLSINSLCHYHLQGVGYDEGEHGIIQKLWSSVDSCLLDFKFNDINEILKHLPKMLMLRHRKYNKIQSEKQKKQYVNDLPSLRV